MKRSTLLLLVSLVALIALPVAAQVNDTYVIPAAANAGGANGTYWKTRFSVFNPQPHELTVRVVFIPSGGKTGPWDKIVLPPNASAWSDNLLHDLFRTTGGGSLLVAALPEDNPGVANSVLARSFTVTSATYTDSPRGTYGQTIPGTWTGLLDVDSDGISAIAHGIRNSVAQGWRTNVGAANLGSCSVTLWTTIYDVDGRLVRENVPLIIPPYAHIQDRLPIEVSEGTLEFFVQDTCATDDERYAVVFPYVSVIDQISGDPTYFEPVLLASAGTLYGKKAIENSDPASFGKKITIEDARKLVARSQRTTVGAQLSRGANGAMMISQ